MSDDKKPVGPVEILPPIGSGLPMPGQVALQARGTYVTAVQVQKPRDLMEVDARLNQEANLMGEAAYYGWGAGDDRIEGPSEALAFAAARCWGNTAIEYSPVQETLDSYVFTAHFVDLETGFTLSRPFRQSKRWKVYGKLDETRKEDVRFQIGATKAARNVILKALPSWLIDKALETAKAGVRAKLEAFIEKKGISAAQDLIVSELAKCAVKEEAILAKFGVAERKALDTDKLVILRGDLKALQTGQERASELFPSIAAKTEKSDAGKNVYERIVDNATPTTTETETEQGNAANGLVSAERAAQIRDYAEQELGTLYTPTFLQLACKRVSKDRAEHLGQLTPEEAEAVLADVDEAKKTQEAYGPAGKRRGR